MLNIITIITYQNTYSFFFVCDMNISSKTVIVVFVSEERH